MKLQKSVVVRSEKIDDNVTERTEDVYVVEERVAKSPAYIIVFSFVLGFLAVCLAIWMSL